MNDNGWCFRLNIFVRRFGDKLKIYRSFPEYSKYKDKIKEIDVLCIKSDKKEYDNFILCYQEINTQFCMHVNEETIILNVNTGLRI